MKKLITSFLLLASPLMASAYDIAVENADGVTIYYNYINNGTELEVTRKSSNSSDRYSGAVNIPEEVTYMARTRKVTSIGYAAFSECDNLTSITIPNSVTSIGNYAFDGCNGLTSITIPNSVTSIGEWAFRGSSLTSVTIPNSVTNIGNNAFSSCSGLSSVTIPNSVTTIGNHAFEYCSGLTSVTIPNSVTSIGDGTFESCSSLTSVTIGNSVTSIGWEAFQHCSSLTSVTIGNSVTSIGVSAFSNCGLTSITIPNSVTSIGYGTFHNCSSLTSVTIGNSVTSIGSDAFQYCSGLTSVHITDLAAWCKIAFNGSYSNPLFYAHHLFMNGEEIKDLVIPNSVTSIGSGAFPYCSSLTSITIPNSVTSIGEWAFRDCSSMTSVISKMENPCFIGENCFHQDVFYNATLYVPKGTTDKYKSTDNWYKFLFIEEGEPGSSTQPEEKKCATPTISYADKRLTFSCETEEVEYHYTITDSDIKSDVASSIDLSATYEISVYATKSGYTNSDVATATLVWTDAVFTETTPSTSSAKAVAESIPVLISAKNGTITVRGEQNGLPLTVYTADGKMLGSATMKDGQASISTNLQRGEIAIVKVGSKSVKIKM